jgi:hypothetical protein
MMMMMIMMMMMDPDIVDNVVSAACKFVLMNSKALR